MNVCKLNDNAKTPTYAHENDACFDLYAATVAGASHVGHVVYDGSPLICGTGLAFEVPPGYAMLVFSRSGHGFKHGVRLSNCVGVVDAEFSGEVMVQLTCDAPPEDMWGKELPAYKVNIGDRIAQAMLVAVPRVSFEVVEQLGLTERGTGGFGSSGV